MGGSDYTSSSGSHLQWVGYRAWLLKWDGSQWRYTDQNRDGAYDRKPLLQTQVTSSGNGSGANWWNAESRRWVNSNDVFFPVRDAGYYQVRTEFFWYADQYVGSGYDVLDSRAHYTTYGGYSTTSGAWCRY